ncbi:hypothetical protein P7H62_03685 [Vagococcus carniphilus]|uniref:hypothetical protein n=1 Tax=Vagococcus carniphilus TaxID=218144 RepID=UPI00288CA633|nr:hypothetical protein [Vagococcus carniphilus]MDT2830271.1 hypothetical protein [Vagococcus carniphilus]MDT2838703.1 hypothetical protein [Vagococcus carniphilus]MDT2853541.1 hypothetical protein [Vagococcus carniphilus]
MSNINKEVELRQENINKDEKVEVYEGITETGIKYIVTGNKYTKDTEYYDIYRDIELFNVKEEPSEEEIEDILRDFGISKDCVGEYKEEGMFVGYEKRSIPDKVYEVDGFSCYISDYYYIDSSQEVRISLSGVSLRSMGGTDYWEDKVMDSIHEGVELFKTNKSKEYERLKIEWEKALNEQYQEYLEERYLDEDDKKLVEELIDNSRFEYADIEDIVIEYYVDDEFSCIISMAEKLAYEEIKYGENSIGEDESIVAIEYYIEEEISKLLMNNGYM